MSRGLATLWWMLLMIPGAALAQDSLREQLHALGQRACTQVWAAGGLDGVDYGRQALAAGLSQTDYCACVGSLFESQTGGPGDEDAEVFMQRLIANSMTSCLTESAEPGWVEDGVFAGEDFGFDPGDVQMCQMALDDAVPVPGFDSAQVVGQLARTGQSREDLCTCAARYFTAGGEPLQHALESAPNPSVVYGSTMAGAIATCLAD